MTELTILVLAAGASRRMRGADKLLLCVDGVPCLRYVALQALATAYPVVVTIPQDNPLRRAALDGLGVTILPVADPAEGIAAGLRAGYDLVRDRSALMILPADMPDLTSADLNRLIAAHKAEPSAILRGAAGSIAGHPVILPPAFLPQLGQVSGDIGARDIIQQNQSAVKLVPLPAQHATRDLDTPEDWADWQADREVRHGGRHGGRQGGQNEHPSMVDPLAAALLRPAEATLAVITGVIGASYRSPGAMMCLFADGTSAGSLTNGCIEGDLAQHARAAFRDGRVIDLRYGAGSPFFDIRLPCGGGLEVTLFPRPNAGILAQIAKLRADRTAFSICFSRDGSLALEGPAQTEWRGKTFVADQSPSVQVLVYGEGPEAVLFARLLHAAGIPHHLFTPSEATLAATLRSGCTATLAPLSSAASAQLQADARTAVVTFFHDHDRELPILRAALQSPAFYVGAQGSRKVAAQRLEALRAMGVSQTDLDRVHGPIGSHSSSRQPHSLAATVLAEILAKSEMTHVPRLAP